MLVRIHARLVFLAGAIAAGLWAAPASVQAQTPAQGISSSSVTMAPSGQAVSVPQQAPREPTAEDLRLRDQALQRSNPPQVPVPVASGGFVQRTPAVAPTAAPASAPISRASFNSDAPAPPTADPPQTPNAPGTMTYFLAQTQAPFASASKSVINEPSVGTSNDVVFVTSNWDAAYSTDRGATFTHLNPYTTFPASNGGFCCDQTATYDRTNNVMIWQLQYVNNSAGNIYRIAFAAPASIPNWCYYDFSPQQMGQPTGAWFDYPDIALTNSFLYVTARVFPASGGSIGTAIWRIPLAAAAQCQSITWNYNVFTDAFTFSLAQGATTTMYFFRHLSTSQERLFNWPDSSGTISWNDINVTTWFDAARSCPGPDGLNWCARNNGSTIGRTSWVAGGVIGTMWSSSQGTDRPYPYVRVARFNESTKALINEPDMWSSTTAFIYPSVNINGRGHLGGAVFFGGGTLYPSLATLIWDDFSAAPPGWELYGVVASTNGDTTWGDYSTTRRHGASGNTWVATGQYKTSASAVRTQYVWFGRERDAPPSNDYFPNALTVAVGGFATGSNVNATKQENEPTHAGRVTATATVWWRFTPSTSGSINLTTSGSNFDTVLAVYTGSTVGS
ncbi:MAG: hypothetical protein IT536_15135 [Hyphomicrobiales bacterium]|nr:hypothetical protein [Hyphomicrobiales bacterium]